MDSIILVIFTTRHHGLSHRPSEYLISLGGFAFFTEGVTTCKLSGSAPIEQSSLGITVSRLPVLWLGSKDNRQVR
jgi:hypothetical protein